MRILDIVAVASVALPLAAASGSAMAATAHNAQAGAYGTSSNAGDPTNGSPHVKHAMKHKPMQKPM